MEGYGLPERMFETSYEPSGWKRINNYFNRRWIDVINQCISDEPHAMMAESQFRQILQMGQHTFSVMFVHQLLYRMEEYGLPERMFETGYEPSGRKRINNYFNLRWIDVINQCIFDEHQAMMAESQFQQILQMGQHMFSVMFVHQLLCRQLVTAKL